MVTAYETGALSDVTIVGQNEATQTTELRIEAGEKPIYLLASIYEPKIWRITGHWERVRKFGVASSGPPAGVVGMPREAIVFRAQPGCVAYVSEPTKERIANHVGALKGALDVASIKIVSAYSLGVPRFRLRRSIPPIGTVSSD